MVGLDAAGKTTILYKLKLGEIVTTIPTIGKYPLITARQDWHFFYFDTFNFAPYFYRQMIKPKIMGTKTIEK